MENKSGHRMRVNGKEDTTEEMKKATKKAAKEATKEWNEKG